MSDDLCCCEASGRADFNSMSYLRSWRDLIVHLLPQASKSAVAAAFAPIDSAFGLPRRATVCRPFNKNGRQWPAD